MDGQNKTTFFRIDSKSVETNGSPSGGLFYREEGARLSLSPEPRKKCVGTWSAPKSEPMILDVFAFLKEIYGQEIYGRTCFGEENRR